MLFCSLRYPPEETSLDSIRQGVIGQATGFNNLKEVVPRKKNNVSCVCGKALR
jgi:hypothetical protein